MHAEFRSRLRFLQKARQRYFDTLLAPGTSARRKASSRRNLIEVDVRIDELKHLRAAVRRGDAERKETP